VGGGAGVGVAGLAVVALVPGVRLALLAHSAGLPDAQGTVAGLAAAYAAVVLATVSSAAVGAVLASRRRVTPSAGCCSVPGWRWP
jgi:hypothetical protein